MTHGEPITRKPAGPAGTGPQETPAEAPPAVAPGEVRFEREDVTPRAVAKALAGLVVVMVVVVVLLVPLFGWYKAREQRSDPPPPPMGGHPQGRLPAEPRLQTTPLQDLAAIHEEEERLLTSYGWVDQKSGVVRIPIDEAMRLVAQRGLPATPAGPAAAASPAASPAPGASAIPPAAPPVAPSPGAGH